MISISALPVSLPIILESVMLSRAGRILINDISLVFPALHAKCAITVLMGPNGAGKSLLLQLMAGLIAQDQGVIKWGDRGIDRGANAAHAKPVTRSIGMILQKPVMLKRKVWENLAYGHRLSGHNRAQAKILAFEQLTRAGLENLANISAPELSGGEQQQIALLRAMSLNPSLLLLDEPTANLDPASCAKIERLVKEIASSGVPCLFVSHNIQQVRRLADFVLFMDHGRLDPILPASEFFNKTASHGAQAFLDGAIQFK